MALSAQTEPAVNIPSKKRPNNQCTLNTLVTKPPNTRDIKKPTQVDVHNVQLTKSPKNLERFLINSLVDSKIDPHTIIDVIPYAVRIHNSNISILYHFNII